MFSSRGTLLLVSVALWGRSRGGKLRALDLRSEKGGRGLGLSSSSSSQISSASAMFLRRKRVMLRRSLFLDVGVRGGLGNAPLLKSGCSGSRWASSSSVEPWLGRRLVSASESLSSGTKPMPGVNGV